MRANKDTFRFGKDALTTETLYRLAASCDVPGIVTDDTWEKLNKLREDVEGFLKSGVASYGINTGFGFLSNVKINQGDLSALQQNLVRSHACGVGNPSSAEVVRGLLLLRVHTFCVGYSGISRQVVDTLLRFLKHDILPVIPEQGSVGASGDLAPLAHLALGLMGEGRCFFEGEVVDAKIALKKAGVEPVKLGPKEGLSLINGTHYMTALAAFAVEEAKILLKSADVIAALSLDAVRGTTTAFDPRIHQARPHLGQALVAENFYSKLFATTDPILKSHENCDRVQDPYSFRCIPQVHGASRDCLDFVQQKVEIELNSVTDNPLVVNGVIVSGGNFHGQIISLSMDLLTMAVSEIGSISERRTEKMTNPSMSGLPSFITKNGGLNSGYMIPHVVAAALASENKILCHPASTDSIPTSADKEDHVSMGPIAARKCRTVIRNVSKILAIELLAACQGIDLLAPLEPNKILKEVYSLVRSVSPYMDQDRSLHQDIEKISELILKGDIIRQVEKLGVELN
ncbi:MAG: histidine ammonia-lyase [Oligoflexales bacterium]